MPLPFLGEWRGERERGRGGERREEWREGRRERGRGEMGDGRGGRRGEVYLLPDAPVSRKFYTNLRANFGYGATPKNL
jgi:hypothetical protein